MGGWRVGLRACWSRAWRERGRGLGLLRRAGAASFGRMAEMYRYEGLEARLYDTLDELSGFEDLPFYQWFAEAGGGPALDLGCGTGRVLLPLAESGIEVVGLDGSLEMLEQCRLALQARGLRAELELGDMRDFRLPGRRFGSILVPGFSAQLLLEDAELESCLACCREHLADGGQLLVSTHLPWDIIWDGRAEAPLEERRRVEAGKSGERLLAYQGWKLDARAQLLELRNRYERQDSLGKTLEAEEKTMTLRWRLPHEMMELLGSAGFGDVSLYGDFGFEPPEPESESVVYLARV